MRTQSLIKGLFIAFFIFINAQVLIAQDILNGKDLSQIKVDALSAGDIAKLKTQLNSSGLTPEQAEQMAISKGMPATEAAKLKAKLNGGTVGATNNNVNGGIPDGKSAERTNNSTEQLDSYKAGKTLINPLIFGSELYTSVAPSFEPNLKLATPVNYILGPDDHIQITVYGVQEYNGDLLVSAEGNVTIPNVGQVKVAGLTIEAATQKLKTVMGNSVYGYLKSGGAKISVTLSKIRSIKVTIIGSNRPGTFNVSSLSTVFNALYIAGGPGAFGSFREIELIRNNKIERKIDLYRFLLEGNQNDNIGLKDNDVIRIPAYKTRVEIQGQVKRPGIFEVLNGESFSKILSYASGFTDSAYMSSVKVFQRNDKERQMHDLFANQYSVYHPISGDVVVVSAILNRFVNRVKIKGAVYRPDVYELTQGLKVADLIRHADGLKEDAYVLRAQIIRRQEDLTLSNLSFDVQKALTGDELNNILLQREDSIIISSVLDLKDKLQVTIQGEIRMPGKYDFIDKLTLKDLIIQAGGFTDAAFKNIEIARLIKRDSLSVIDERSSILFNASIDRNNLGKIDSNLVLEPFDVITVRKIAGYQVPESVVVTGQVQYPGIYSLSKMNERVSDLINHAGGLSSNSYPEGAYLKRYKSSNEKEKAQETAKKLDKIANDSSESVTNEILREFDKIPLELVAIIKNPGTTDDIILKANDELYIPKFEAQVKVSGEVLMSTQIPYQSKYSFKDFISGAGGFTATALRSKAYVVYANGKAEATKHFLFFKFYPTIQPGSEIIVPKKRERKNNSLTEIVGLTTILASLATTFVLLKQ